MGAKAEGAEPAAEGAGAQAEATPARLTPRWARKCWCEGTHTNAQRDTPARKREDRPRGTSLPFPLSWEACRWVGCGREGPACAGARRVVYWRRRWVVQADVRMITHIGRHGSVNRQLPLATRSRAPTRHGESREGSSRRAPAGRADIPWTHGMTRRGTSAHVCALRRQGISLGGDPPGHS